MGYIIGRNIHPETTETVRTETIIVRDTIRQYIPKEVAVTTKEKVLMEVRDTIRIHDTLYITLPFEKKFYKDEDYYAEVSGYKPHLDYIEVYPKTTTVTKVETITRKPSPWHLSLAVGLDYSRMGSQYISPNIGAEIAYNRLSLGAEVGLDIKADNMVFSETQGYWQIGVKYNIFAK